MSLMPSLRIRRAGAPPGTAIAPRSRDISPKRMLYLVRPWFSSCV